MWSSEMEHDFGSALIVGKSDLPRRALATISSLAGNQRSTVSSAFPPSERRTSRGWRPTADRSSATRHSTAANALSRSAARTRVFSSFRRAMRLCGAGAATSCSARRAEPTALLMRSSSRVFGLAFIVVHSPRVVENAVPPASVPIRASAYKRRSGLRPKYAVRYYECLCLSARAARHQRHGRPRPSHGGPRVARSRFLCLRPFVERRNDRGFR
jgi:hypothetical protein